MRWEALPFDVLLLLGALAYAATTAYIWRRRSVVGARSLAAAIAAAGVWTLCYAAELASADFALGLRGERWGDLKYVGIVLLVPAWCSFAVQFAGLRRGLSRRAMAALLVEPALVLGLLAVPATHDLIRYYPAGEDGEPLPVAATGPLFWPHLVYTYGLLLAATGLLVGRLARTSRHYRRQAAGLIVAVVLPLVGNAMHNLEVGGFARLDPTPFLFTVTALLLVWGLLRLRLLDLTPVARGAVLEQMAEMVLVVDAYQRVADLNPAMARLLGVGPARVVGRQVADVLPPLVPLLDRAGAHASTVHQEATVAAADGRPCDVAATVTALVDSSGRGSGTVVVLRDVSEQKRAERALQQVVAERTRLAQTLQLSLRPAALPAVPGLRLATRFRPAGDGTELGGDFYDVRLLRPGVHSVVLGDVSGKGAEAAVVTALARYSLQTLAAQGRGPRAVLTALNDVLARQGDDERFCTVAYAELHVQDGGARLRLCLAGHLPPVLRRADGRVERPGRPGTAVGLVAEVVLHEDVVDLAPGDAICFVTDGVTEARRGGEVYGDERLERLVGAVAGADAEELAERVLAGACEFSDALPRDDIAVLVLAVAP